MRFRAGGLFAVALLLVSRPAFAAPATGDVTGQVTTTAGAPIANATVAAAGKSARTAADGRYTLKSLPQGGQTVTASASRYVTGSVTVSVVARKTVTAPVIRLAEAAATTATVSGVVTSATTGSPVSGAVVTVSGSSLSTTANASGGYSLTVPSGAQTLNAAAAGYQSASQSINMAAGTSGTANFALSPVVNSSSSTISWNGSDSFLLGLNFAWWNYGTDFGTGAWGKYTDWANVEQQFAAMSGQGVRVVRWWVFSDGRYAPDWNADGTVAGLDAYVLADLDRAMALAAKYNVYLLLAAADANIFAPASYNSGIQMGGHGALVTNAAVRQSYLDKALRPVIEHVAASPNKAMVLGWDVMNEPELQVQGCWGSQFTVEQMKGFLADSVRYVNTYGGGAHSTVGAAMPQWTTLWKGIGQTFYQFHWYPGFDNGGPFLSSLPTYASLNLDRPCVVGEFATNVSQPQMQAQLDAIRDRGYAGAFAWSYWVGDSATNWTLNQPVFTAWGQNNAGIVGPR
jgi:hypothetical protein